MEVYSIGFTKKSAAEFFQLLGSVGIRRLIDVRLNNVSQLAGFTKRDDLKFFLHELCGAEYRHEPLLAPTDELLTAYRKKKIPWRDYETAFVSLLSARRVEGRFDRTLFDLPSVLLCSEPHPDRCHRRLVLEYLGSKWGGLTIHHL